MTWPQHIAGSTTHTRRGEVRHGFTYGVDYVLIDPQSREAPWLFSRNRFNLMAVHDRHHGGAHNQGRGAAWAHEVFAQEGLAEYTLRLLTQPAYLGYIFNPVSFWLAYRDGDLLAVIAEVSNTFGDRHSYFCARENFAPIGPTDQITARKLMHVSPFQQIAGIYRFRFELTPEKIDIRILHERGDEGLAASLTGVPRPLCNRGILAASLRRPLGALRTMVLIYWQALRLKLKGAPYLTRPTPPSQEVSRCSSSQTE